MSKIYFFCYINLVASFFCIASLGYAAPFSTFTPSPSPPHQEQNIQSENLPVWWENSLGTEPYIIPGFSPLKVIGHSVELFQRKYQWHQSFFPDNIISRNTIIAEDMQLVATIAGQRVILTPGSIQTNETKGVSAHILGLGTAVPNLKVQVNTKIEYDGVAQCAIQLIPTKPVKVDKLEYEVLIKDSPTMEVIGFAAKDIRKQKDRHDILKLPYVGSFLNVLGFSDGDRSFWWFADNAKGWIWNGQTITEAKRENGKILLKQILIGDTFSINKPITFNLNFLATPVKKLDNSWRSKRIILGHPRKEEVAKGGIFKLWWTNAFAHDAFPYTSYPAESEAQISQTDREAFPGWRINATTIRRG